ncbi:hypothetical protein SM124_09040 [Bacillus sp. 31A1R]|uniref:Uncharacterized protein n=1 Tax=Robertmurraya mangrovi TaxID=3098077 RepID=A0ABU5IXK6_9BACI|nr:hypothetical protein [Bacillus sp. 31A1R]MDZ5471893.1 hypothetical protein [Bacillus sp. 31A1R]
MKKFVGMLLTALLILSFSVPSMASANGLLPVKSNSATIKIESAPKKSKITKLELILDNKTIYVGDSQYDNYLDAKVTYQDKTYGYVPIEDVKLTSSSSKILKIVDGRFLLPVKSGKVTITGTYKGVKGKLSLTVKGSANGEFSVAFKGIENANYIDTYFTYVKKNSSKKTDYSYRNFNIKETKTSNGYKFSGLNWDKYSTIYGTIRVEDKVFYLEVNKKQNKKTITLDAASLSEIIINYPTKDVQTTNLSITKIDSNKKMLHLGSFYGESKFFVPKGTYNMQVQAKGSEKYYNLYLKSQKIDDKKQSINISSKNLSLISFTTKPSGSNKLDIQSIGAAFNFNNFNHLSSLSLYDSNGPVTNVYLNNMTYTELSSNVLVNDNWVYEYQLPSNKVSKNMKVTFGDQLKASISFKKNTKLYAGQRIYLPASSSNWGSGVLNVKDQYGNYVTRVYNQKDYKSESAVLVFKGSKKTYRIPINDLTYGTVTLPTVPGTYKVTFEMK